MIVGALSPEAQRAAAEFRGFYDRLSAILARIVDASAPPPDAAPIRDALARDILALGHARMRAPDALRIDAGYVLAAFADEMLLVECAEWAEARHWDALPLEAALYGTALAGERVFAAARALIDGRRDDPRTATTLLMALMMGLRGRWLDRDDQGEIKKIKEDLYTLLTGQTYRAEDPAPYRRMELRPTALTQPSQRPLPALWPWLAAIAGAVLLYFPASHLVWWQTVKTTDAKAQQLIAAARKQGMAPSPSPSATPPKLRPAPSPTPQPGASPAPIPALPDPLDLPAAGNGTANGIATQ